VCDAHTNRNVFPRLTVWDVHTNGNVFPGLTVWEVHSNGDVFPRLTVWDVHMNRKVFPGSTVWDVHMNGNVFLGLTVWCTYEWKCFSGIHHVGCAYERKDWVSMPRQIAHKLILPQPVSQEGLSPKVSRRTPYHPHSLGDGSKCRHGTTAAPSSSLHLPSPFLLPLFNHLFHGGNRPEMTPLFLPGSKRWHCGWTHWSVRRHHLG